MSILAIIGESGSGKSTTLRTLDPERTLIIDSDGKGLSWQGWRKQYKDGVNYFKTSRCDVIYRILEPAMKSDKFTNFCIDTVSGVMLDIEMGRALETGYNKWTELAKSIYDLVNYCAVASSESRNFILTFHTEVDRTNGADAWTQIRVSGRKLGVIGLESKFPIVLLARQIFEERGGKGNNRYVLETQSYRSTAKSPVGMFPEFQIPNDGAYILQRIAEYEGIN
jgi:energy-coupling factor transporter ATP-binding protein EcfA2